MPFIQEAILRPCNPGDECQAALEDAALSLLGTLSKNGQIWGEPLTAWVDGGLHLLAKTPCEDSLDSRYHSSWVEEDVRRLREHCMGSLSWRSRGTSDTQRCSPPDWEECPALYLFTHAFDDSSPVVAGDNGEPVPLYLLQIDPRDREALLFWMRAYRHHDSIWLDSRALEKAAYEQLGAINSELSQRGRALAIGLERALKKPTYYYLHRYHGLRDGEADRPCPGCGGRWARRSDPSTRGLAWFDFRCDECRIVSHQGVDVLDEAVQ